MQVTEVGFYFVHVHTITLVSRRCSVIPADLGMGIRGRCRATIPLPDIRKINLDILTTTVNLGQ